MDRRQLAPACSPVLPAGFFFVLPTLLRAYPRIYRYTGWGAFTFPEPSKPEGQEVPDCCKPKAGCGGRESKGRKPWEADWFPEMANVYRKGERLPS